MNGKKENLVFISKLRVHFINMFQCITCGSFVYKAIGAVRVFTEIVKTRTCSGLYRIVTCAEVNCMIRVKPCKEMWQRAVSALFHKPSDYYYYYYYTLHA